MMRSLKILLLILLSNINMYSQEQTGINTTNVDPSAILEINYADKGMLIPRIALNDANSTSLDGANTAATGLLIWNTNTNITNGYGKGFYMFNGTKWVLLGNTLDKDYDANGTGSGKQIIADNGAVEIKGGDGILITGASSPTVDAGGAGEIIDNTTSGAGVKMFYNPKTSTFRAGYVDSDQWDDNNFQRYSFATGYNTIASSGKTLTANYETVATNHARASAVFGNNTRSTQLNSLATGNTTKILDRNSTAFGLLTISSGLHSFSQGEGSRTYSISEAAIGSYPKKYTPVNEDVDTNNDPTSDNSRVKFYNQDRIFVIGNGTSDLSRSNAFEIRKNGLIKINDKYTLPKTDGNNGEHISTDGSGSTSWVSVSNTKKQTLLTMYADENITINSTSNQNYDGFDMGIIPGIFDDNGDGIVKVKMIIKYSSYTGTHKLKLRVDNGSGGSNIINSGSFTNHSTSASGGSLESGWRIWTFGSVPYEAHLYGKMQNSGDKIVIQNAYIMIKDN